MCRITARVLCDPGSQASFVSERIVAQLSLRKGKCSVTVEGVGATALVHTTGVVNFKLQSIHRADWELHVTAFVLQSITSVTPSSRIDTNRWPYLRNLQLADPHFGTPGSVDILLGADVWGLIVQSHVVSGNSDEPHAQCTRLGYVVFGPANQSAPGTPVCAFRTHINEQSSRLDEILQQFWHLEEVPSPAIADDECERHFIQTHQRQADGRYVVQLPFQSQAPMLGDSYATALRQFYQLERRLSANNELREQYIAFMREYEELGHMYRVIQDGDGAQCYYIPHHPVTGKFRVVFNASAPTTTGISLNDIQLAGPTVQDSLLNILFRFRRFRTALTADIEKMFRQFLVSPCCQDYQRILWRESSSDQLCVYRLKTVTYGMKCSPFLAVRTLNQCALDNSQLASRAEETLSAVLKSFYVDDLLTSCDLPSEAIRLAMDIQTVLNAGGLTLRKWNSNNSEVLQQISGTQDERVITSATTTVLGLRWDAFTDELFYSVILPRCDYQPTKRRVLSEIARLFDPTGLLSPVVVTGKILIQALWATGANWDTPLPPDLRDYWFTFRNGLEQLNRLRIPRWLGMKGGEITKLYGFCDASVKAYAAVIYVVNEDENGHARVRLLTARTKVAPLKGATIPRLELCAAHLLATMLVNVRTSLEMSETELQCRLYSDSRIVLCWLRKSPAELKTYVSNRVHQIQEMTLMDTWHHVRSEQNPADCASRGLTAPELLSHALWWDGPEWLAAGTAPSANDFGALAEHESAILQQEIKLMATMATTRGSRWECTVRSSIGIIPITERFSDLNRLLRTIACVLRASPARRHWRAQRAVSADQMIVALQTLVKLEQNNAFAVEMRCLRKDRQLPSASKLVNLNPYIDADGIMRIGGRIGKSALPYDQRFPIILPQGSYFVKLLVQQTHRETLHGGTQLMLQTLRRQYWIIHARQAVRTCIHACVICRRHRGATLTQQMASLPESRVNCSRPFSASGVDYCGPFNLRIGGKRSKTTVRTYVAIFVCVVFSF